MSKGKRILVVEDNPTIRCMVTDALETDYEVATAENGLMGWLQANVSPHPDLIITDVEMPKLDGIGMVKRLRLHGQAPQVPIIFLTSRDRPVDVIQGMHAGACYYLTKPFGVDDLVLKVRNVFDSDGAG